MSLVIMEGMDKVGKSTVAKHFTDKGYEYIHMSAPARGHTRITYMMEMLNIVTSTGNKNVVMDRSFLGEAVWPYVYNRAPLLYYSDIETLFDVCNMLHINDVRRIYMYDPNRESHINRMKAFKEPSYDYEKTYDLYSDVAMSFNFTFYTFEQAKELGWISNND